MAQLIARLLARALHPAWPQVVGRSEPHNLKVGHPRQKRTLTIRENARAQVGVLLPTVAGSWAGWYLLVLPPLIVLLGYCSMLAKVNPTWLALLLCSCPPPTPTITNPLWQGFPDYHVLLAKPKTSTKRFRRNPTLTQRYQVGRSSGGGEERACGQGGSLLRASRATGGKDERQQKGKREVGRGGVGQAFRHASPCLGAAGSALGARDSWAASTPARLPRPSCPARTHPSSLP